MATAPLPTPRKVVTYPLASAPDGGALFLFGKSNSPRIALLCGGFPDDHELFLPFASRLANEADCLVGVTCLPGYDHRDDFPYSRHKKEGYSFDEIVAAQREAAKALRRESTCKGGAQLTGIFHDWGVAFGLMFANRCLEEGNAALCPDRIVLFDVLPKPHPKAKGVPVAPDETAFEIVVALTYRIALAVAFAIRLHLSKILAQIVFGVALLGLRTLRLLPTLDIDAKVWKLRQRPISLDRLVYMSYPYYRMIQAVFGGKERIKEAFYGCYLPKDLEKTPVLYTYGVEKRINFHDRAAVMMLEEKREGNGRSRAIAVEDAGHWLYLQQPDICTEEKPGTWRINL